MALELVGPLGTEFTHFLRGFRPFFPSSETLDHFDNYVRGLLSDLSRKTVEPIALACGTVVRTLQQFLKACQWDQHGLVRATQQRLAVEMPSSVGDPLGTVGIIDETSSLKKGDKTPGVQRQYLGCVGKIENGIVSVHLAVVRGGAKALLANDLFLPKAWSHDRERCRKADIPDALKHQPKWQLALAQVGQAQDNGWHFDWLVFDEGYGSKTSFLRLMDIVGQRYIGEVPKSFSCRTATRNKNQRAEALFADPAVPKKKAKTLRMAQQTVADTVWSVQSMPVCLGDDTVPKHRLVRGQNLSTGEVKYWITNAARTVGLRLLVKVALQRWQVEHTFRVAKQEVGLMHFEGRSYQSLVRHWALCLVALAFVTLHTHELKKKIPT